ncbi:MAG: transposase [Kiritimatiellae bacterium]|nr:transposase [Kiritimatiellia bacterium]
MTFLANNTKCEAGTVRELYRARWEIEVFFKELKPTLLLH